MGEIENKYKKMIAAHVLVKNEARFIWFSVMSVIDYVDRVRIWDTGSTDGTLEIIDEILKTQVGKEKVILKKIAPAHFNEELVRQAMLDEKEEGFAKVRQEMLDITIADWFIVVDADEIWWDDSISKVTKFIREKGENYESIVVPTVNLVGDMYHHQEKAAGMYHLAGKVGHYNLRGVNRKIPGLKSLGEHGVWGWADGKDKMIQDRDVKKVKFLNAPYLHATHLQRAGRRAADLEVYKRDFKLKHEIGISFPKDYFYPEVFFRPRPKIVGSVWTPMNNRFRLKSFVETPLRKIKRRILPYSVGY